LPVEEHKHGQITKYKCDLCRSDYPNQRELHEHLRLDHKIFTYDEQRRLMNKADKEIHESSRKKSKRTTKFICKVCGQGFEDGKLLDAHIVQAHHSKRTITVHDIVYKVFDGILNYPKTKVEIVKEAERNKDNKPEITPEIIDTLRNLPDKRFNDEAELAYAIQTSRLL